MLPELLVFFERFENLFQRWLHGEIETRPMNEEYERVVRHSGRHTPKHCKHGFTALTCSICYFNGFNGDDRE